MPSEEFKQVLDLLKPDDSPEDPTLEESRAGYESMASQFAFPDDVTTEPVDAGGVPAEWVVASEADFGRTMLYLHGGGYVIGSPDSHRGMAARLSRAALSRVLLIDYRLAPEHPFPAAVEDATAAYRWMLDQGIEPSQTTIAGDSAGGGLTVAALVALRDAGDPPPAAGIPISPWTDMEGLGESMTTKSSVDPIIQRDYLLEMAKIYLDGADPRDPLAAPIYADLTGLPPLLIQVGGSETMLDDATRLADRAEATGVDVTLEVWEEMIHVWHWFASMLPEGQQAIDRIGEYVLEKTGAPAFTSRGTTPA